MKQEQQQQARKLYFQTNLNKTEIAEQLNVSRRTVYNWSVEGDWDKLRPRHATCPPSLPRNVITSLATSPTIY